MRVTAVPVLVQQLLAHEAEQTQNQQKEQRLLEAAQRACEKLRVHLSTRIGRDGFRVLLARALRLAAVQFPHLSAVRVAPDGTLEGLPSSPPDNPSNQPQRGDKKTQNEAIEGAAAILTHLLELLVTFIGDDLTRRMLSTLWPQIDSPELWGYGGMDTNTGTITKEPANGREEER